MRGLIALCLLAGGCFDVNASTLLACAEACRPALVRMADKDKCECSLVCLPGDGPRDGGAK